MDRKQVTRIWSNLKRRDAPRFSRIELSVWADQRSVDGRGQIWRCPYCGIYLQPDKVSPDHQTPLQLGGTTSLDNLELVCERCNRAKGILTDGQFRQLLEMVKGEPIKCEACARETSRLPWPAKAIESVIKRLAQKPSWRGPRK